MSAPLSRFFLTLILLPTLLAPKGVGADHCTVAKIAIVQGSWENSATQISLTLQTQDSLGASCHTGETLRFSLESSSGGTFTAQTGGAVSMFVSANTANRNFYYIGTNSGTIIAKAGYGTADSWTEQFSTVYTLGNTPPTQNEDSSSTTVATSTDTNTSTSSTSSSSHYSSNSLNKSLEIKTVSAGRARIGTVGSPLEFRVDTPVSTRASDHIWTMGDGTVKSGVSIVHTYNYPGEYVVVLNVASKSSDLVSRTNVKISEANLTVSVANSERIELTNNTNSEVNLYGRALLVGEKVFNFPQDTIILPKQKISFPSSATELAPSSAQEVSIIVIGSDWDSKHIAGVVTALGIEKERKIAEIQGEMTELQTRLASMTQPARVAVPQSFDTEVTHVEVVAEEPQESEPQAALVLGAVETEEPGLLARWFGGFKRFFLRNE